MFSILQMVEQTKAVGVIEGRINGLHELVLLFNNYIIIDIRGNVGRKWLTYKVIWDHCRKLNFR